MFAASSDFGALRDAVQWVAGLATGSAATAVAVISVAWIGFAALQGRIEARKAARIVLGCFVIFGAPSIAAALAGSVSSPVSLARYAPEPMDQSVPPMPAPAPYDPYAGAS